MKDKKPIIIENSHNDPVTIHFNYSGECQRPGEGSAPSLSNIAQSCVLFLSEKLDKKYYSKFRYVSSEIMSLRSYEIRRKNVLPNFLKENLFRDFGFRLLFDSKYSEFDSAPDVIADLNANFSKFPLIIYNNASKEEREALEEWDKKRRIKKDY